MRPTISSALQSLSNILKVELRGNIKEERRNEAAEREMSAMNNKQEVSLKEWCFTEAERAHISRHAVYLRIKRGLYPGLRLRYVNQRVVFVSQAAFPPNDIAHARRDHDHE